MTLDWKKLYRLVESFQGRLRDECLTASIGAVIAADQKLGGLCDWVEAEAPRTFDLPVEGAVSLKEAVIPVVVHYSRAGPLCWLRP